MIRPDSTGLTNFIPQDYIEELLKRPPASEKEVRRVLTKSLNKERLELDEMAVLLSVTDQDLQEEIFEAARKLKKTVYGNRIVMFAPLYVGNKCVNSCLYCGFRAANKDAVRRTLTDDELRAEVRALIDKGHKRLVIDFGEHPDYDVDVLARTVEIIYSTKHKNGEIRRVNMNCIPLDVEGYKKMKQVGIGTYQIFQETYHVPTYKAMHQHGPKSDFLWRLYGQDRAMEGGCDDVGIGALFALYDWRFEALGMLAHTIHLEEVWGVGPHTLSFPRIKDASNRAFDPRWAVSDADFKRLIAILRLSVPYVGMILTAREPARLRRELIDFGCSQIDAGTRIGIGAYSSEEEEQDIKKEQFMIGDCRPLDEVIGELIDLDEIPSWCTACYRKGRTGEHFMEFAIPGFIKRFCTPNALLTLKEYMCDYASDEVKAKGGKLIADELEKMPDSEQKKELLSRLERTEKGERDIQF